MPAFYGLLEKEMPAVRRQTRQPEPLPDVLLGAQAPPRLPPVAVSCFYSQLLGSPPASLEIADRETLARR